jgi:hypothetical protein
VINRPKIGQFFVEHFLKGSVVMDRSMFLPWFIGLAIIVAADGYLLYFRTDEGAAELAQQTAMVAIPIVALGLMFLMFKSQK